MTWFTARGFGWVHHEVDGEVKSYFAHISNIVGTPTQGATVRFEVGEGKKGPKAVNIEIVEIKIDSGISALAGGQ